MNTIILACSCDSLVDKVCAKLCACCPKIIEPCTNDADVAITAIICKSLVLIALIGMIGFLVWRLIEHHAKKSAEVREMNKENDNRKSKLKSDLLDKYLDFLKEQTKEKGEVSLEEYEKVRNGYIDQLIDMTQKETDETQENLRNLIKDFIKSPKLSPRERNMSPNSQYRQILEYLIELSQQDKLGEISKEKMEEFFKQEKSTDNEGQNT